METLLEHHNSAGRKIQFNGISDYCFSDAVLTSTDLPSAFIFILFCIPLPTVAPLAQRVKSRPTDLEVPGSSRS